MELEWSLNGASRLDVPERCPAKGDHALLEAFVRPVQAFPGPCNLPKKGSPPLSPRPLRRKCAAHSRVVGGGCLLRVARRPSRTPLRPTSERHGRPANIGK